MSAAAGSPPAAAKPLEYFLFLALAITWSSTYAFIRVAVETIPPLTLISARTIIAGAILYLILRLKGLSLPSDLQTWGKFLFQATLNTAIPFLMIAWAEKTVSAGLATILTSTVPIFAFLINWAITRSEPPTPLKLLGVILGIAGVALIVGVEALQALGQGLGAQLLLLGSALCYAWAAIFGRNFAGFHDLVPATGSLYAGLLLMIPLSILVDRPWTLHPSREAILATIGMAIIATTLGFILYFRLLRTLGPVALTAQSYLRVPIGVMIGVVFLGETLAPTAWIGLVCVVLGVAAMTIPIRSRAR